MAAMKRAALLVLLICIVPALAQQRGGDEPVNAYAGNVPAIGEGRVVYESNCLQCHGANGAAGQIGPALGGQTTRTQLQIFRIIKNGVAGTAMPPWTETISDDDMWRIVTYLDALRGTAIDSPTQGDVTLGEQVFWGKGACGACHMIKGRGKLQGPDLGNLAGTRKTAAIVDALTKVEHRVYEGGGLQPTINSLSTWLPVRIIRRDGKQVGGLLMNQDSYSVQVIGDDDSLHLIDRADIRTMTISPKSRMPTDYDKRLSKDEFRNLLAFLTQLSSGPRTAPGR